MSIIETKRLTLREFSEQDAPFILTLLNTPGWLKYIGTRNVKTLEDARGYITAKLMESYKKNGFGFYLMQVKTDRAPIGMCGLVKRDTLDDVDIGFALLPEYEGKGYAYEAAAATMDHAKNTLKLKRISAITVPGNTGSISLLKKIDMHFEKMVKLAGDKEELMLFVNK